MKTRLIKALSTGVLCFSVLAACDLLSESIADGLVPPPRLAYLADYISPIGSLLLLVPVLIAVGQFFTEKNKKENPADYISSFLMLIGAILILSLSLTLGGHYMMLNGEREISIGRFIGNAILLGFSGLFIYIGTKTPIQSELDNA
jgi:hypothetical protein